MSLLPLDLELCGRVKLRQAAGHAWEACSSCRKAVAAGEVVSLSPLSGYLSHKGVGSGGGRVFRESQEHAGALAKENRRAKGWLGAKSLLVTEVHRRQRELLPSPT